MKKLLFVFIMVNVFVHISAQITTFKGTVKDESGKPIDYVQITLTANDTLAAYASTVDGGKFFINNIVPGSYKVELSMLGYEDVGMDVTVSGDVRMNFVMKENAMMLDSVVVTTERPRTTTATGHIYYLSKKARESGNPFKALQEVPDIVSNHITQSVSAIDGKKMMIMIDGVKINSGIATIDPKRIDYVEVNDVVSARFMREGYNKILNIHLKPEKTLYQFYEYGLRNDFPHYWGSTWGKAEVGTDKFSVYVNVAPEYTHDQESGSDGLIESDYYTKTIKQNSESSSKAVDYTVMLKYKASPKDYLAPYFQGNNSSSHKETNGNGTFVDYTDLNLTDNSLTSDYRSKSLSRVYSGTLFYRRMINGKMTFENYFSGTYNFNNLRNNTVDIYPDEVWNGRSDFDTRKITVSNDADFSWNINNGTSFSLGSTTTYTYDRLLEKCGSSPIYRHKEWDEYLYASITGKVKSFMFMVSAGYSGIWRQSADIKDHYYRPYIASSFTLDMKQAGSLQLSYVLNSASPEVSMLNPYDTSTDSLRHNVGNPYLKPQETHGASLRYSYYRKGFYAGAILGYNYIMDRYENIGYIDDDGAYTSTFINLGHYSNIRLSAILNYRKNNTTIGSFLSHFIEYFPGEKAKKSFSGNLYVLQTIGKWGLYGAIDYTNFSYTNISTRHNLTPLTSNVFVSYNFTPNLSLSVGAIHLIKNLKSKMHVKDKDYEMFTLDRQDVFHPYILFRWTIRKNTQKQMKLNNNILKDIQKDINLQDRKY